MRAVFVIKWSRKVSAWLGERVSVFETKQIDTKAALTYTNR